jgi:hypothetical protein
MATAVRITAVRTEPGWGYSAHEHIAALELENRTDLRVSREWVIEQIRDPNGYRFYTLAGGVRADVVVRGCPSCAFGSYITTLPDNTTTNNLLSLPRFY